MTTLADQIREALERAPEKAPTLRMLRENKALRDVLDLHAPEAWFSGPHSDPAGYLCRECQRDPAEGQYPCPTVRAVAAALGITEGTTP